jgi:glycerol kinase
MTAAGTGDVVVALDAGTHAVRTLAFDMETGAATRCGSADLPLQHRQPGWAEIDPDVLAEHSIDVLRQAVGWAAEQGRRIVALGVTNMRETAIAWSRSSGKALHPGIVWMSQQSEPVVRRWRAAGLDPLIREHTGLGNNTFFFGSKLAWMLEQSPTVADAAATDDLAVGMVDCWLINVLTGRRVHSTDTSNGSRSQLMNLRSTQWDPRLGSALGIPMGCLPELRPSMGLFGTTDPDVCGAEIPITGDVADQQASLFGHGCEEPGSMKVTFGTSGVVCLNTGSTILDRAGMVTSVAWTTETGETRYEVEGSAFHSGYTIGWLAEHLDGGAPTDFAVEPPATAAEDRVYLLPSFSVLGAPRWPRRQGAVLAGLAMSTTNRDIVRAGLEAMAFQAYDLYAAVAADAAHMTEVSVDGGGASSDYICQLVADLCEVDVVRPDLRELTSVGAAKAALRGAGYPADRHFGQQRSAATRFRPRTGHRYAREGYRHWVELVNTVLA